MRRAWNRFKLFLVDLLVVTKKNKQVKIAYSPYLKSNIRCLAKINDQHWLFYPCDSAGRKKGKVQKAGTRHSYFDWKKVFT